jgi:hypothetical protein
MATNITLTNLRGDEEIVDAELIADLSSDIDPMTADELAAAGVSKGTRITLSAGSPVEVLESVQLVKTIAAAALGTSRGIGAAILRDTMPAATQVFNAAGPAPITGLSITIPAGGGGSYLAILSGVIESSDAANAGGTIGLTKGGVAVGVKAEWGAGGFVNNASKKSVSLGLQYAATLVAGDIIAAEVAVTPGGVGGDDITVTDCSITLIRLS